MAEAAQIPASENVQPEAKGIPADPPAFDRAAVESKVKDRLASVFGDDDDTGTDETAEIETGTDEVQPGEHEAADTTEQTEQVKDEADAVETDAGKTPEENEQQTAGAAAKKETAPTLPAAYVRSLKSRGWTDEKINADYEKFGLDFVDLAERIHKSRNTEINEWAEAGRRTRQQQSAAGAQNVDEQQQPESKQQRETLPMTLKPVDAAKLKQRYGEDSLIDEIVTPINAVVEQINKILPAVQQTQQRSQQSELETLGRQIEGFFGGKELEPYTNVYGNLTNGAPSSEQIASRNKVLETADALMVGAKVQGRTLSLGEALQLAHDSLSSGYKEQAVRTTIKKQLKTREKAISLRPTSRGGSTANSAAPKNRTEMERKVAQGLRAAFA